MDILNRQKIKNVDIKKVRKYLGKIFSYLMIEPKRASFVLCDNSFIKKLNNKYFNKSIPTDVIAFPLADDIEPDYLGEAVVSVEEAVLTSKELKIDWQKELLLYLIHGVLHLVGFRDDTPVERKKIEQKQQEVLARFKTVKLEQ
ncbi:MAG: rRNA maturation RNase YbeY [Candidatus Omnitrophota bacterium]